MKRKELLKTVSFLVGFCLIFMCFAQIFTTYKYHSDRAIRNFYHQERDSLDVVFLGSSAVSAYWNPLRAWESYGFTSYNYSSNSQPFMLARYLIDEIEKTQSPKLYVIDLRTSYFSHKRFTQNDRLHGFRYLSDNMPFSLSKLKMIHEVFPEEDKISYYVPWLKYHSRWKDLARTDFEGGQPPEEFFGYVPSLACEDIESCFQKQVDTTAIEPLEKEVWENVQLLLDYLEQTQTPVLFVNSPMVIADSFGGEGVLYYKQIEEVIRSRGFSVLDFNQEQVYEDVGFDFSRDFINTTHTNYYGSLKYTDYLGMYIMQQYNISCEHEKSVVSVWDQKEDGLKIYIKEQMEAIANPKE